MDAKGGETKKEEPSEDGSSISERERAAASAASIRSKAENCHRRNSLPPLNDEMVRATLCVAKPK